MQRAPTGDLASLARLLQLASPSLPVGGYGYSQGLESALHQGLARTPDEVERWIADHLVLVLGRCDAPYWWRLARAFAAGDLAEAARWNEEYLACRDGAEPRNETRQMGFSLVRMLEEVEGEALPGAWKGEVSYLAASAHLAVRWSLPLPDALLGHLWSWLDAQVLAWLKTGAAGQMAGRRMLSRLADALPGIVESSEAASDDELQSFSPGLALAGYAHEIQDGRMFRS
ncbi:urease accessory protein UreF [Vulgatibacter incomptus]|uniref:Urease accessory protein UreF n=1 Tax=Vulgatibacter incomptus TaxID=1391653 RepID=A0A0K1PFZ1_9BACT|nr:urease accessory UreF family protein [Vulgatibacter incomptus]AKU92435.1 Urease accessory protein UreF [Vulgatibacter incomptus]